MVASSLGDNAPMQFIDFGNASNKTERGGFEPPVSLTPQQISSLPHSTALPPLQQKCAFVILQIELMICQRNYQ